MNVKKSAVFDAVQDGNALFDARNQYIKLPRIAAETAACMCFPDSAHDARVLQNSDLYDEPERGAILQEPCVTIGGTDIRPYQVPYPQTPWLIKPFPEGTRDHEEVTFDKELSRARVTVEQVFSILKSRLRVLQNRLDTVEPQYNEPQYNDIPSIMINMLCPGERYSKMYGTEARYNNL